jgi:nitrogen fixation protein FixH
MSGSGRAIERDGAWIAWVFVGFLGVVLTANGALIWFATASWPGLVTESPYDKGLTYNQNLDAAARQAALGWQTTFVAQLTRALEAEATLELRDRKGEPLAGAEVIAAFERPAEQRLDFVVPLLPNGLGTYRARFTAPVPGLWHVHLTIRRGGEMHVGDERVILR